MPREGPVIPRAIEPNEDFSWVDEDGVESPDYDVTFDADDIGRFREGRACLRCFEVQPEARPKKELHLPGCSYSPDGIKDRQPRDFALEFKGEKWLGPRRSPQEEFEIGREERLRAQGITVAKSQIVLPRGVSP